ncbi:MAG: hypothetical protein ABI809_14785, partial [Caldimonas sp.]
MPTARVLAFFLLAMASAVAIADDSEIRLSGAVIELNYVGDASGLDRGEVRDWIGAAAHAVEHYYGRYPVKRVRIRIETGEGHGAHSGTTYSRNGALIRVGVGRYSDN